MKLLRLGVACCTVTDNLKRRLKAPMLRVLHFLPLCENFCVRVFCYAWLISIYSHHGSFFGDILQLEGYIVGAFLFVAPYFFPLSETHPRSKGTCPHNGPSVRVCVFAYCCVSNVFHYQTLFSVLNGTFFFFLLVWTRETISRQSRVHCFCFCPVVRLEPLAFSAGVGIVPSSRVGYAARRVSWK